jgi:tetratricopeptide (TPR) repeat protein
MERSPRAHACFGPSHRGTRTGDASLGLVIGKCPLMNSRPSFNCSTAVRGKMKVPFLAAICILLSCAHKGADNYYRAALLEQDYMYAEAADELDRIPEGDPIYRKAREHAGTLREKVRILESSRSLAGKAMEEKDFQLARSELRKVLELRPDDAEVRNKLVELEEGLSLDAMENELDEVDKQLGALDLKEAEKLKASVENLLSRGRPLAAKNRLAQEMKANSSNRNHRKMLARIERDIAKRTKKVETILERAKEQEAAGDYILAALELRRAPEAWSEDSRAENELARLKQRVNADLRNRVRAAESMVSEGKLEKAVSMLEQNMEASEDDQASLALLKKILNEEGMRNYLAGNYSKALESWEKLREYDPEDEAVKENVSKTRKLLKEMQKFK